jgi:hypothetical protein
MYTAWFETLPTVFRAMVPGAGTGTTATARATTDSAAPARPTEQIGNAIHLLDGILTRLYESYLPLLAKGQLSAEPLKALADGASQAFNQWLAALALPEAGLPKLADWSGLMQFGAPWSTLLQGAPLGAAGEASGAKQLRLGMERTFGGLAEAFGLGPLREFEQACASMLAASAAKQRAQVEYLAVVAEAWSKGTLGLVQDLQAMGSRGERIESLLAFIRLWAKAVDAPLHEAMQGARGLDVTAKVIRASSQHREQVQKVVGLASEALHVPTRADLDEAFREIQELKRELRRIRKTLPAAAQRKLIEAREQQA